MASKGLPHVQEYSLLVRSFFATAFGRTADEKALSFWVPKLRMGMSLDHFAENLVRSHEFQKRHGSSPEVDIQYLAALDSDRLWRLPELEGLARWVSAGEHGTTRAKVLAAMASSRKLPAVIREEQRVNFGFFLSGVGSEAIRHREDLLLA